METALINIGLSEAEAQIYTVLLKHDTLTVSRIAENSGESRTNTYAVLESLEKRGLVLKDTTKAVLHYRAANPTELQQISSQLRADVNRADEALREILPDMIQTYNLSSERPGVQFFQGNQALAEIYDDVLKTGKDILVLRSPFDDEAMGNSFYKRFKQAKCDAGIKTTMVSSEKNISQEDLALDTKLGIKRHILADGAYEEPVEISVYGNKVSTISFGNETIGTVIHSALIANAIRQIISQLPVK